MNPDRLLLLGASVAWSTVNRARHWLFSSGVLSATRLPCRVVSVGNIQVGGSGKTPITAFLAAQAIERGLKPLILTRGYHSRWESSGGVMAPHQSVSSLECGDEASLLRLLVPDAAIAVGANRLENFERAKTQLGLPDLVILEDGMQHLQIARDLELVCVTGKKFGELLHREFSSSLSRASLVLLNKGATSTESAKGVPQLRVNTRLEVIHPSRDSKLEGRTVLLACGVGDPETVCASVTRAGGRILETRFFPDHHKYSASEVQDLNRQAKLMGATLLTTTKDWVKWKELDPRLAVWVVESRVTSIEPGEIWEEIIWSRS